MDVKDLAGAYVAVGLRLLAERYRELYDRVCETMDRLDRAQNSADYQAIGISCRDLLIEFGRAVFSSDYLSDDQPIPGESDAKARIAIALSELGHSDASRELRKLIDADWAYALLVQHDRKATRREAERTFLFTVLAIIETLEIEDAAVRNDVNFDRHGIYKCPICGRSDLNEETDVDVDSDGPYLIGYYLACECGWTSISGIGGGRGYVR